MDEVKITFVSFDPVLGDPGKNLKKIEEIVTSVSETENPDVIIFPELASSGYLLENLTFDSGIKIPDDLPAGILKASVKREIILGVLINDEHKFYNAVIVISDKKIIHIQKKIYLPTYGLFDEGRYFTPGEALTSYEGKLGKTGILICEDAFHPALAYSLYTRGVRHVIVPSCSPGRGIHMEDKKEEGNLSSYVRWRKRLEIYSESFGQFYYYVNRSGCEDGVHFRGESIFVSPNRESLEMSEHISSAVVHRNDLEAAIEAGGPFQYENWDLNHRILEDGWNHRK